MQRVPIQRGLPGLLVGGSQLHLAAAHVGQRDLRAAQVGDGGLKGPHLGQQRGQTAAAGVLRAIGGVIKTPGLRLQAGLLLP